MKLAISGTYSSGKTLTSIALAHYTGLPRTRAKTMREILPEAAPGKTLEECTAAELIQMIVVRHVDRAVHENRLGETFISDGSSLQEWIYGMIRVDVGINPNDSAHLDDGQRVPRTPELRTFDDVMTRLGVSMKQHVRRTFDAFMHLPNELPLTEDGHRPVNDRFRRMADETLLTVLAELGIPVHIIGGSLTERLVTAAETFGFTPVTEPGVAIENAEREYREINDMINGLRQLETAR
jgi:nicotinamide riboside kinase